MEQLILNLHKDRKNISKNVDKYLIPQDMEKKKNAEVSTPFKLRQEMLDTITAYGDPDFWRTPKKVFEPCAGKGGFLIDIVDRFLEGGLDYKTIVEKCLYFADINPTNIFICRLLLDPYNTYALNYYQGDTLKLDIKKEWGLKVFDAVIGNPPYQANNSLGTGTPIWNRFVIFSLNLLRDSGFLVFVHPAGWRKHATSGHFKDLYREMVQKNNMLYLSIHGTKDGLQTFNCGTRYDWYIIQKGDIVAETLIRNELGKFESINLKNTQLCPNYNITHTLTNLTSESEKLTVMRNCNYHSTTMKKKGILSDTLDDIYKYRIFHSITKSKILYKYSKTNDRDSFGVSKIIFADNGCTNVIIDMEGEYGTSEHILYVKVESIEEAQLLKKAIESEEFKDFIQSITLSNYQIDYKILSLLKKEFWKEFV